MALRSSNSHGNEIRNKVRRVQIIIVLVTFLNIALILLGVISSAWRFHYSLTLIIAILLIPITAYLMLLTCKTIPNPLYTKLATLFIAIVPFVFTTKYIANGVEEHEVTSDMINIYLNGYFRWSIHGSHYDLAPLDAILKVMLTHITGSNIYDPVLGVVMYGLFGLASLLTVYTFAKKISGRPMLATAIVLLVMTSYPYSPLVGLVQSPAALSQLLAFIALTIIVKSLLGHSSFSARDLIAALIFIIHSILLHPSALTIPLYLALIALLLAHRGELDRHQYLLYIILASATIYMYKALYTAFATSFIGYLNTIVEFVRGVFSEEAIELTTRNVGYSALPRLCLTGFALLPGFIGGITIALMFNFFKKKGASLVEGLFLITAALYAFISVCSLLIGLGGISQSRVLFNGAQPYMELILIIYLSTLLCKIRRHVLLIPLLIASFFILLTPNAMPLNYTIPMATKGPTLNDHIVSYTFTQLVEEEFYATLYRSCGDSGRILVLQERGEYSYGIGSTMAIVRYFIAPRKIPAKSYWDPCVMAIHAVPAIHKKFIINRVFDAWVYGFYLYIC